MAQVYEEYIRYCIELEQTVSALEAYPHTSDDLKEIAIQTLKTACDFYGGNWAGIWLSQIASIIKPQYCSLRIQQAPEA